MKKTLSLSIICGMLALVSCTETETKYAEKACAKAEEAAKILMECKEWKDAFDTADDLHAIADELDDLREKHRKDYVTIREEEDEMTNKEYEEYKKAMSEMNKEAKEKFQEGVKHINGNDAGKSQYLRFGISRLERYF